MDRVRFLSKVVLAACLSFALAFTLSCSSDDGNSGGNCGCEVASPSSSSSVGEQGSSSSEDRGCSIQSYKTVEIGTQTWMAENLNCVGEDAVNPVGACYNSAPLNCNIYGRLYDWSTAKWICPTGWHLPTDAEWDILVNYAGGSEVAGTKLKAKSGWNNNGNGTDNYGFSALPGGISCGSISYSGAWWSTTEHEQYTSTAYIKRMDSANGSVATSSTNTTRGLSVRCLKDQ